MHFSTSKPATSEFVRLADAIKKGGNLRHSDMLETKNMFRRTIKLREDILDFFEAEARFEIGQRKRILESIVADKRAILEQ